MSILSARSSGTADCSSKCCAMGVRKDAILEAEALLFLLPNALVEGGRTVTSKSRASAPNSLAK